jgi:hypothetical protein
MPQTVISTIPAQSQQAYYTQLNHLKITFMTNRQEDQLGMYDAVITQNENNKKTTETMPALQNAYTALKAVAAAIRNTAQLYDAARKGESQNKAEQKQAIAGFNLQVAGALFAWAADKGNTLLMEKVKTNITALSDMRDELLANLSDYYHGLATDNQAALAEYGLSKEVIDSYKMAIDGYKAAVPAPRNAMAMRKAYREKLTALFKEGNGILKNKIDKLILPLKKASPEYLAAYTANRRTVSSGSSRTAIRIVVKDAATGQAIGGAKVSIEALKFETQTDKLGQGLAKPVPPGAYAASVTAQGYRPQTVGELKTALGKTNTVEVLLEKAA